MDYIGKEIEAMQKIIDAQAQQIADLKTDLAATKEIMRGYSLSLTQCVSERDAADRMSDELTSTRAECDSLHQQIAALKAEDRSPHGNIEAQQIADLQCRLDAMETLIAEQRRERDAAWEIAHAANDTCTQQAATIAQWERIAEALADGTLNVYEASTSTPTEPRWLANSCGDWRKAVVGSSRKAALLAWDAEQQKKGG